MKSSVADVERIPTEREEHILAERIVRVVVAETKILLEELTGPSRKARVVTARQVAMYLIRTETTLTLKAIGRMFERDHSTVIHSVGVVEDELAVNERGREAVARLRALVTPKPAVEPLRVEQFGAEVVNG